MNLHLGCGGIHKDNFVNIDIRLTKAVDIVADTLYLPFKNACIDRIECFHLIEHIEHPLINHVFLEWRRVMKMGGYLVIECPDGDETMRQYLDGDESKLRNIYGAQRWEGDAHYWCYNVKRLNNILFDIGFEYIREGDPQDYHIKEEPCIRIECKKYG